MDDNKSKMKVVKKAVKMIVSKEEEGEEQLKIPNDSVEKMTEEGESENRQERKLDES